MSFSVIADDPCRAVHEPVALPGGYVFVPAALFLAAQDEAEFTGMLAHAIGHIALRHGFRSASQGPIVNYSSIPLVFMGGLIGCSENQSMPLAFAAAQRNAELEADSWAAQTLARAGVDPHALVRYRGRVNAAPPRRSLQPSADERIATLLPFIEKLDVSGSDPAQTPEFAALQQEIRNLAEAHKRHSRPRWFANRNRNGQKRKKPPNATGALTRAVRGCTPSSEDAGRPYRRGSSSGVRMP